MSIAALQPAHLKQYEQHDTMEHIIFDTIDIEKEM